MISHLYKYTQNVYALKMVQTGQCRVGTLFEYRDKEKHGSEVGDSDEGRKTTYSNDPLIDWTKPETVPDIVKRVVKVGEGRNPIFQNCWFNVNEESPDCYVFSVAEALNPNVMREFGYDAVVRITHPNLFFQALTECLQNMRRIKSEFTLSKCRYIDRTQHYSRQHSIHPAFMKDPRYKYQQEVRVIWIPEENPIEPVILECPQLRMHCSLISNAELMKEN